MKIMKQLVWIAPLGLLIAGCAAPVREDNVVAAWRYENQDQLPQTGSSVERVYSMPESAPMPTIVVESHRNDSSDISLADSIRRQLEFNEGLKPSMQHVTISVRDGRVTLRGSVRSDLDKRVIMDNLRELPGVGHIKDELRVNANWD